jgi:hypothetical protein
MENRKLTMKVKVIRTDGREEDHTVSRATPLQEIYRLIGCDTIDTVNLRDGNVMLVDDDGYDCEFVDHGQQPTGPGGQLAQTFENRPVRARKPVNPKATAMYHAVCQPGTTHQIVGDVAIALDADFA